MLSLPDVAVVGSINVDLTAAVARLPAPGETIGGGTLRRAPGGKGANQAAAASRLGARTRVIGAVGADSDGDWMLRALAGAGVDVTGVRRAGSATGTALIAVDSGGENQIVVCPGANAEASIDGISFGRDETVLTQLELDMDLVSLLAKTVPGFLVVNASPARPLPAELVRRADLFVVNAAEYALAPELNGARLVAVTYGADGAALLERGHQVARAAAPRVTPVSTVGAGDGFCAALALGLRAGLAREEALRAACAVGAAAVLSPEAQPPFGRLDTYRADLSR